MANNHPPEFGRIFPALGLIALGVMFFMGVGLLWPLFMLVPGLIMLMMALDGGEVGAATFSVPGALLAGLGGLMFVQNLTNYWESWAYAWTLIPVFVGAGLHVMARGMGARDLNRVAGWLVKGGLYAFIGFGIFFEFVIGLGGISSGGAVLMILVGLVLLFNTLSDKPRLSTALGDHAYGGKSKRKSKRKNDDDLLFTGPVVVGSSHRRRDLTYLEEDASRADRRFTRD